MQLTQTRARKVQREAFGLQHLPGIESAENNFEPAKGVKICLNSLATPIIIAARHPNSSAYITSVMSCPRLHLS